MLQAWQQYFEMQAQQHAALHAAKDDALQQVTRAQQMLKSCENDTSAMVRFTLPLLITIVTQATSIKSSTLTWEFKAR